MRKPIQGDYAPCWKLPLWKWHKEQSSLYQSVLFNHLLPTALLSAPHCLTWRVYPFPYNGIQDPSWSAYCLVSLIFSLLCSTANSSSTLVLLVTQKAICLQFHTSVKCFSSNWNAFSSPFCLGNPCFSFESQLMCYFCEAFFSLSWERGWSLHTASQSAACHPKCCVLVTLPELGLLFFFALPMPRTGPAVYHTLSKHFLT